MPDAAASDTSRDRPAATGGASAVESENALLRKLLKMESAARTAESEAELSYLAVNDVLQVVRARQVFMLSRKDARRFAVTAVSSLAVVDRNVPLVRWVEQMVQALARNEGIERRCEFVLPAYCDADDPTTDTYPFANIMWVPLWSRDGVPDLGLLMAREAPWIEPDRRVLERLAETFGHAFSQLRGTVRPFSRALLCKRGALAVLVAVILASLVPMPISAIAPAEVVARDADVVAMPVEGIVEKVLVDPNQAVRRGDRLVRLNDTIARNKLLVAQREVVVAEARVEQANSRAFSDAQGRHELGIARAELQLKIAERDFARAILEQHNIIADRDGIAVFADRKYLEGKPLKTGDFLMQVATPGSVELEIELPVADSIALKKGAPLRVFLDSNPLDALSGTVAHVDYEARLSKGNIASYRIIGNFDALPDDVPRLGTRGTAQIYGPTGTMALHLFRRPLSAFRQWAGV